MTEHRSQRDSYSKRKRGRPLVGDADGADSIKQAALREFATLGYKGASIEKIALSAGVAKPLVHYHFSSKEELWKTAVSEAFDILQKQSLMFVSQFSTADLGELIDRFAYTLVCFSADNPWLVRISTDETRQGGERASWLRKKYLIPLHELSFQCLKPLSNLNDAEIKARLAHIVPSIYGAVNFPFIDADVLSEAYNSDVFDDAYIRQQADFVAVLIRASMQRFELMNFSKA